MTALFTTVWVLLALCFSSLIYLSYQDYVHPRNVYGKWIEVDAPDYNTDVLFLNERGVYRNERLISTRFLFDGTTVTIKTGQGNYVYQVAGSDNKPLLKRLEPSIPPKRFAKGS
ncbi:MULTISPECIES: DUF2850 domain-containing protein [Vibrio]|nr:MULTISPECIES: DUF2850 domain-containing protein [Vibrio]